MTLTRYICETCYGEVEERNGEYICLSCGNKYHFSNNLTESIIIELNNANFQRKLSYFDKSLEMYDQIISENKDCVEAGFGAILADYGVEYVQDYDGTYKPTCHRLNEVEIRKSRYYDLLNKEYKEKVKEIEEVRKQVLEESKKIKPYDVFICYKETSIEDKTKQTIESKWAEDIYNFLTYKAKLRVFYAEKSLSKSNKDYEPHIYSALRSAKIMFVLTTSLENITSPWVQNEWKRYSTYIRNGEEKIIRVILDKNKINPYKLPRELSNKQAIDHELSSWSEDVINAAIEVCKKKTIIEEENITNKTSNNRDDYQNNYQNVRIEPLLKRTKMFLENEEWNNADEYCERVLDIDPENSQAYIYKLFAQLEINNEEDLILCDKPLDTIDEFKKALKYCDENIKQILNQCLETQKEKLEIKLKKEKKELKTKNEIHQLENKMIMLKNDIQKCDNVIDLLQSKVKSIKLTIVNLSIYASIIGALVLGGFTNIGVFYIIGGIGFYLTIALMWFVIKKCGISRKHFLAVFFTSGFYGFFLSIYLLFSSVNAKRDLQFSINKKKRLENEFNSIDKRRYELVLSLSS